jgi:hypothetical protein
MVKTKKLQNRQTILEKSRTFWENGPTVGGTILIVFEFLKESDRYLKFGVNLTRFPGSQIIALQVLGYQ